MFAPCQTTSLLLCTQFIRLSVKLIAFPLSYILRLRVCCSCLSLNVICTTAKEQGHAIDLTVCGIEYKVKTLKHQGYALVSKDTLEHTRTASKKCIKADLQRALSLAGRKQFVKYMAARQRLVVPSSGREHCIRLQKRCVAFDLKSARWIIAYVRSSRRHTSVFTLYIKTRKPPAAPFSVI